MNRQEQRTKQERTEETENKVEKNSLPALCSLCCLLFEFFVEDKQPAAWWNGRHKGLKKLSGMQKPWKIRGFSLFASVPSGPEKSETGFSGFQDFPAKWRGNSRLGSSAPVAFARD